MLEDTGGNQFRMILGGGSHAFQVFKGAAEGFFADDMFSGGKSIFGEGFPTIEVLEPEHEQEPEPKPVFESKPEPKPEPKVEIPRPLAVPKVYTMPKPQVKPAPAVERVAMAVPQTSVQVHSFETEEPVKHMRLVALNSKSDAKRAFIYSEIFNRKY